MFCNFAEIKISNNPITLFREQYSDQKLTELREKYSHTHCIFRDKNEIFSYSKKGEGPISDNKYSFIWYDRPVLTKKLIHQMIFDKLLQTNIVPERFTPIEFNSRKLNDNLLYEMMPKYGDLKLKLLKRYFIDTRVITPGNKTSIGLIINSSYRWTNDYNCAELINYIRLNGKRACTLLQGRPDLAPYSKYAGIIKNVECGIAELEELDIKLKLSLEQLYLFNTRRNIDELLNSLFGVKTAREIIEFTSDKSAMNGQQLTEANQIIYDWFRTRALSNETGVSFEIGDLIDAQSSLWERFSLEKPTFVYNYHGNQTNSWNDGGLRKYGPWDKVHFETKKPTIAVICRSQSRGAVTSFLGKLKSGVSHEKNVFNGLISKYHLNDVSFRVFEASTGTAQGYEKAIADCFSTNDIYDLAIVETTEEYKSLPANQNPYFIAKVKFMNSCIPVQEVKLENMKKPDSSLVYILNNIALACYAKMKGVPWVIPTSQTVDHELVVGIGSSFTKPIAGKRKRVVGITTIFSGDGNYLLNNKSKDVLFEDYFDELLITLKSAIQEVRLKYNWQAGDTVRLIFHTFKPLKNIEINVIKNAVEELQVDLEIKFAFLHISQAHPFRIFDPKQEGIVDWSTKKKKGVYQPIRGTNLALDDYNHILQLVGPNELKTARQGMSAPLLIRLHSYSTFKDMNYLTQQVYSFSHLSWRSFFPSSIPITILYSRLTAQLLGNMRQFPNWDIDLVVNRLKFSMWFL